MEAIPITAAGAWAMAGIAMTWALAGAALLGLGLLARRPFAPRESAANADGLVACYASGLAIAIGLLQVWHLFAPAAGLAAAALLALGLVGLAFSAGEITRSLRAAGRRAALPLTLFALAGLWLCNRALAAPTGTDADLYHLQAVRWDHTFAIVPGLANMHPRLGFNNANHLLAAAAGSGPWESAGGHLVTGLFVLGLWAAGILGMVRAWRGETRRFEDVYDAALLGPAFLMAVHGDFASPSTDLPAAAMSLIASSMLVKLLLAREAGTEHHRGRAEMIALTLVLAGAVCIKLSAAAFAGSAWLVAVWALASAARWKMKAIAPTLALALAAGLALAGPWAARGVILSGHPFFPSTAVSFDVPWRTPTEIAAFTQLEVTSWARRPAAAVAPSTDWSWVQTRLREYVQAEPMTVLYPLLFAMAALAAAGVATRTRPGPGPATRRVWPSAAIMLVVWLATTAAWFLTAPALRFAWHLFFIPPAVGAGVLLSVLAGRPRATTAVLAACMLALLVRVHEPLLFQDLLAVPGRGSAMDGGLASAPTSPTSPFVTRSGLRINVPADGRCWDAPLPCTPFPRAGLRLRREGELGSGFVLEKE